MLQLHCRKVKAWVAPRLLPKMAAEAQVASLLSTVATAVDMAEMLKEVQVALLQSAVELLLEVVAVSLRGLLQSSSEVLQPSIE